MANYAKTKQPIRHRNGVYAIRPSCTRQLPCHLLHHGCRHINIHEGWHICERCKSLNLRLYWFWVL
eukprot:2922924-Ditylum_brightwellii.AAC.1